MTGARYIVYQANGSGLGHVLVSIMNCAHYAYTTGRICALDMSSFQYYKNDRHSQFFKDFKIVAPGVTLETDLNKINEILATPDLFQIPATSDKVPIDAQIDEAVIFAPGNLIAHWYSIETKSEYNVIRVELGDRIRPDVETALAGITWSRSTIGLYFRHGNGEFLHGRFDYRIFSKYDWVYDLIQRRYIDLATKQAAAAGSDDVGFFVASDNEEFRAKIKSSLRGSFSLAGSVPKESYAKFISKNAFDRSIIVDAVKDLWGLSTCNHLIYSKSQFPLFSILNSPNLNSTNTKMVPIPSLEDLIETDPERAVGCLQQALSRRYNKGLFRGMIMALRRLGRTEDVKWHVMRRRWTIAVHNEPNLQRAQFLRSNGRVAEAIAAAELGVKDLPGNPEAMILLSDLYLWDNRILDAKALLDRATEIDPGAPAYQRRLSRVLRRLGAVEPALAAAGRAIDLAPEGPENLLNLRGIKTRLPISGRPPKSNAHERLLATNV